MTISLVEEVEDKFVLGAFEWVRGDELRPGDQIWTEPSPYWHKIVQAWDATPQYNNGYMNLTFEDKSGMIVKLTDKHRVRPAGSQVVVVEVLQDVHTLEVEELPGTPWRFLEGTVNRCTTPWVSWGRRLDNGEYRELEKGWEKYVVNVAGPHEIPVYRLLDWMSNA
jgi:hypothetical protein